MASIIPTGFPTADTTGVPSGTILTAYTGPMTISTDGTVIENKIINGSLDITGDNVVIKNCRIVYNDFFAINVRGLNVTVQNCDIVGPGYSGDSPAAISCDVGGGKFLNNDISGAEHGIVLGPGASVVKGNYIHDGGSNKADPHIGGISLKGDQANVLIEDNTVIGRSDATSDIFLQNNWGPISNVTINHNYLAGDPGYDIYVEGRLSGGPVTGISITNNVIVKGHYGYYSVVDASPKISGNVELAPGSTIPSDPTTPTDPTPTDPTTPETAAPSIASFSNDSGVVGDHITNDKTLTLTGTAIANSTVKVFDGSTQIGTATANSSGAWSVITTALADGSHALTSTSTNSGGTSGASTALPVTVDTKAPLAPTIAASTPASTHVEVLTGTAEANSTVAVFDGTTKIGTATTNPSGAWSYTTAALSSGSHSFTATATDITGNTGAASSAAVVTIAATTQTAAPGAPTIASFSNDSGVVGDHVTNDNTLTLTGTATANSTVKVFDGSTQLGTATVNSSGAWSLTTTPLVDGSHSLTATTTTPSTPGTSPLIFEDFNPWNGNVSPDGIWRVAGTWQGTGGNTLQPGNVSFTNTYPGESNTGFMYLTVPAGSPLRGAELQSLTTPGYSYGFYEARIKPTDVKGGGVVSFFWIEQPNYGSHEWDVEFTLSDSWAGTSNPGRVSFTTHPLDNTQWVNLGFNPSQAFHDYGFLWTPGRIDFTVDGQIVRTVTDPNLKTDATGYIMMNTWSGISNFGGGPPSQDATSVYDWVKFYPGATSIPVDGGSTGGTSGASAPLSVAVDTKAPLAPTIAASTPASTHVEVLTGTAEANSTVAVFDGTTKIGTATTNSSGAWSYTTAALSSGSHSFTATATDIAGNTGTASSAAVVTIGAQTAPGAPTIASFSNDSGAVGDHITNDKTLTLTGTAIANSTVKVFDGSTQIGTATANSSGAWSVITTALADGSHALTSTSTNSGGTSGASTALPVTVDTKAPLAPTIAASTPASTHVEVLTGTAEANSTVAVFDGTTKIGTATTNSSGAWSYTTAALSSGSHSFTATATDIAGNTGTASSGAVVTIAAASMIKGGSGNDLLTGDGSDNTILGYAGNDTLNGGTGADNLGGGAGNDTYVVDNVGDKVDEAGGNGVDTVQSSISFSLANTARVFGEVENLRLIGPGNISGTGNVLNNVIIGNAGANVLDGGGGNDIIIGLGGDDRLYGGIGNDAVNGGSGNDVLYGGGGNDYLIGEGGHDTLNGGIDNDVLVGGSGRDLLIGSLGADRMVFQSIADTSTSPSTRDIILDFDPTMDRIDLSQIDANTSIAGNQAFTLLATPGAAFTAAGQLHLTYTNVNGIAHTIIEGNVNKALGADFQIDVVGHIKVEANDFML